jgi:hypothetical protein
MRSIFNFFLTDAIKTVNIGQLQSNEINSNQIEIFLLYLFIFDIN